MDSGSGRAMINMRERERERDQGHDYKDYKCERTICLQLKHETW